MRDNSRSIRGAWHSGTTRKGREGFLEEVPFELAPEGYIGVHARLLGRWWINESGFQGEGQACARGSFEKLVNGKE